MLLNPIILSSWRRDLQKCQWTEWRLRIFQISAIPDAAALFSGFIIQNIFRTKPGKSTLQKHSNPGHSLISILSLNIFLRYELLTLPIPSNSAGGGGGGCRKGHSLIHLPGKQTVILGITPLQGSQVEDATLLYHILESCWVSWVNNTQPEILQYWSSWINGLLVGHLPSG